MTIPPKEPKPTRGASKAQLHCDFQHWLLWAKVNYPDAPPAIRGCTPKPPEFPNEIKKFVTY